MFARPYRQLRRSAGQSGFWVVLLLCAVFAKDAGAEEVRIAVAANFTDAAKEIGTLFEHKSGHRPLFSFGSTGQLYAQIAQGAPFDVFLAADQARPEQAIAEGLAVPGSRFTYARGRLVLYSREAGRVEGQRSLLVGGFDKLAIANPETAPYGAAAIEAMKALGSYDKLAPKLVRGNNIAQTFQFVATGNAELGFVALSQLAVDRGGSRWLVPAGLHTPIAQDAVLLERGRDNETARAFLAYLKSEAARAVVARHGYEG